MSFFVRRLERRVPNPGGERPMEQAIRLMNGVQRKSLGGPAFGMRRDKREIARSLAFEEPAHLAQMVMKVTTQFRDDFRIARLGIGADGPGDYLLDQPIQHEVDFRLQAACDRRYDTSAAQSCHRPAQ